MLFCCVVSSTKITSISVQTNLNSMFCWQCISIFLCNKNQLDALFILSLFHLSTSTCFGYICSPSSRGMLYIHNTYQLLCIYSIPPDDGLQIYPKHVEVDRWNKLRINSASSWFLLHKSTFYLCVYIYIYIYVSTYFTLSQAILYFTIGL
jgi:hypothetical protein